jgi:hypothetical protein
MIAPPKLPAQSSPRQIPPARPALQPEGQAWPRPSPPGHGGWTLAQRVHLTMIGLSMIWAAAAPIAIWLTMTLFAAGPVRWWPMVIVVLILWSWVETVRWLAELTPLRSRRRAAAAMPAAAPPQTAESLSSAPIGSAVAKPARRGPMRQIVLALLLLVGPPALFFSGHSILDPDNPMDTVGGCAVTVGWAMGGVLLCEALLACAAARWPAANRFQAAVMASLKAGKKR